MSSAGGLRYHWRALRYRRVRWRGFRQVVAGWLSAWRPPCGQLILVGPSAGHTLSLGALGGFDDIVALEPDPLARAWLRRRALPLRLRFDPVVPLTSGEGLASLVDRYPQAAFLFCNLLGQIAPPQASGWHLPIGRSLGSRHWASYHDVISTHRAPKPGAPAEVHSDGPLETVLTQFWGGGEIVLVDHGTFRLDGGTPARYAVWPLTAHRYHLIEWVTHAPGPA